MNFWIFFTVLALVKSDFLLDFINQKRKDSPDNLQPLCYNAKLVKCALSSSRTLRRDNPNPLAPIKREDAGRRILQKCDYQWVSFAENIAIGHQSIQQVAESWWADDQNKANMLRPDLQQMGWARSGEGPNSFWTLDMGSAANEICSQ